MSSGPSAPTYRSVGEYDSADARGSHPHPSVGRLRLRDRLESAIDIDSMRLTGIISTLSHCLVIASATPTYAEQHSWTAPTTNDVRVPVTLGVMSRCPDALKCETLFDNVIPRVREKINLSLAYVAKYVLAHTVH